MFEKYLSLIWYSFFNHFLKQDTQDLPDLRSRRNTKDIHHIFSHQVGRTPREEMIKALGAPSNKDYFTFDVLGNMGSCALPITFAMGIEKRQVKKDDHVVLMGFGSGINCLFFGVQW